MRLLTARAVPPSVRAILPVRADGVEVPAIVVLPALGLELCLGVKRG
ncbi:MAG TPA: hypothetical protein VMP86_05405 [Candidatus Binatia bacterium]|nr:hypothetical protein [Candidatus Binatia bacterium]